MSEEVKYAYRFPPCPVDDMETMESWLEDLAKTGLILSKDGSFAGFFIFEKREPSDMRYRLQPLPRKDSLFRDAGPDAEAIDLAEEYGWQYLGNHGEFAYYGTEDPQARELDTDTQVQALTMKQFYRRRCRSAVVTAVILALAMGLLFWLGPVSYVLEHPQWHLWTMVVLWILYAVQTWREFRRLRAWKRQLAVGEPLSKDKDWKKGRLRHWCSAVFSVAVVLVFYVGLFAGDFLEVADANWEPLSGAPQPFATMEDLAAGGSFRPTNWATGHTHHAAYRTTVLGEQILLRQFGEMVEEEQVTLSGNLQVRYYDLRSQWLAEVLYEELQRSDRDSRHYHLLELPELNTDRACAYSNYFPTLLLQDGTKVLHVTFSQFDTEASIPLEQWAAVMARSLTAPGT